MPTRKKPAQTGDKGIPGLAIDAYGGQTVDPTENVLDLVHASTKRHDDLRAADSDRLNTIFELLKRLSEAESRRVDEQAKLRAEYSQQLVDAEAKRIDAIRAVDVNAVSVASERATAQATVLATQVQASAETLRSLVATAATSQATQLTQIITPITDRLALLEKSQYEGKGKEGVADPILRQLAEDLRTLREERRESSGTTKGVNATMVMGLTIFGLLIGMLTLLFRK